MKSGRSSILCWTSNRRQFAPQVCEEQDLNVVNVAEVGSVNGRYILKVFHGSGYGANIMVKDSARYAESGGWGYYSFGHREPKAPTARVKARGECAYCHINS